MPNSYGSLYSEPIETREDSVFAMDNDPATPLRDSMSAQRLKARLAYQENRPFVRPKPSTLLAVTPTVLPKPKDRVLPKILGGIGVCVMVSAVFAGPISLCIGISIIGLALGIDALFGPKSISVAAPLEAKLSEGLIANFKTKSPVLDLRHINVKQLPDGLCEYDHLKFIVLNQSSAARFKQFHFHSEILIGR